MSSRGEAAESWGGAFGAVDREEEAGEEKNAAVTALVEAACKGGAEVQAMLSRELAAMIQVSCRGLSRRWWWDSAS